MFGEWGMRAWGWHSRQGGAKVRSGTARDMGDPQVGQPGYRRWLGPIDGQELGLWMVSDRQQVT